MLPAFAILLCLQLAGEALVRLIVSPVPGPVMGMALLFVFLIVRAPLPHATNETADGILKHLSLLFVPAGVGVVQQLPLLGAEGWKLLAIILVSSVFALAVTALTFAALTRLLKIETPATPEAGE